MGLAPVHMLPGDASPEIIAAASLDTPGPAPVSTTAPAVSNTSASKPRPKPTPARPIATKILASQLMVWAVLLLIGGWSRWWLYPLLWLAPWMTVWRVINRLRATAEHAGLMMSPDRRLTSHVVRQSPLARFWMVPYNTGWHLAHHVDMGVPWRNLTAFHQELVDSGWVTEELTYPSYRAFWKACASG